MGVIYRISCERCGTAFEHQAGVGFAYACVGCGEVVVDEQAPFRCPCCNMRYDPRDEEFSAKLTEAVLWD